MKQPAPFSATVEVKTMLAAVRRATTLVIRTTLPVLTHIKLEADSDRVTVSGTNCDCWLSSTFDAGHAEGGILVPGKELEQALAVLPNGAQAKLEMDGAKLRMTCGRTRFEFPTMDIRDWPAGAEPERPTALRIPAREFIGALESLREAISTDPNKYYLTGVFFDFHAGRLVATTGSILGWEPAPWVLEDAAKPKPFILPADAIAPLKKMLEDATEADLVIDGDSKRVAVRQGGDYFITKLVDGQFPDYIRAVPPQTHHERAFRAERDDVATTLNRTKVMVDGKVRAVMASFAGGELTLRSKDEDGGIAEDTCGAQLVSGSGDIEVALSSRNLQWCLDSLPVSGGIVFQLTGPYSAVCVVTSEDQDRRHLRVIMPVRMP